MAQAIEITRLGRAAGELRREASRCGNSRIACRILAIAHVLDGASRTEAAAACGMDRQTLRDWVHGYNANGLAGLSDAPRSGRPPALLPEQLQDLKELALRRARPGASRCGSLALC